MTEPTLQDEADLASAIIDNLALADTLATWEYPGMLWVRISPTEMLATGLHGYHYGQIDVLKDDMYDLCACGDEEHHFMDLAAENERDPVVIATVLAAFVQSRQSRA